MTHESEAWSRFRTAWDAFVGAWDTSLVQDGQQEAMVNGEQGYRRAWASHWQALGQPWRTEPEIGEERQRALLAYLAIRPQIDQGIYPFAGIELTRSDVEWLLAAHEHGRGPVDWSDEHQRAREGLDLRGARVRSIDLSNLPLARMRGGLSATEWPGRTPEQRYLAGVHLEGANLRAAHLEGAILRRAYLERAELSDTRLEQADLVGGHLGAAFTRARLEKARLQSALLERAFLIDAQLAGADLRGASFDRVSTLSGASLGNSVHGWVRLADVHWGEMNLSTIEWSSVRILGDEWKARQRRHQNGAVKDPGDRINDYQSAARAYRQLAIALRSQGITAVADRFTYRAQVMQRELLWLEIGLPMPGFKQDLARLLALPPQQGMRFTVQVGQQILQQGRHFGKQVNLKRGLRELGYWMQALGAHLWTRTRKLQAKDWLTRLWQRPVRELGMACLLLFLAVLLSILQWWGLLFTFGILALLTMSLRQRRGRKLMAYLFSLFLAVLTGYGFRLWRIIVTYVFLILTFGGAYWVLDRHAHDPLNFAQAVIVSITAFHGRVFSYNPFTLSDPQILLTAIEAICGLIIEGLFVAMLVQRFFSR